MSKVETEAIADARQIIKNELPRFNTLGAGHGLAWKYGTKHCPSLFSQIKQRRNDGFFRQD